MSALNGSASLKRPNPGNKQISGHGSSKKCCAKKIVVTFADDIMRDFLKFISWKAINKCQEVDSKWFQFIKREKAKKMSTLPPELSERFEMSSAGYEIDWETEDLREIKDSENSEMQCFANCALIKNISTGRARKTRTVTGNKQDRRIIRLGINVRKEIKEEGEEGGIDIFSWKFDNKIRNYFWAHLEHWFQHLREPFGLIAAVTLVPFDTKIWETMGKNNPYLVDRIYAVSLAINCTLLKGNEFEWVLNFCQKHCSAKELIWNIEKNGDNGVDMDDEDVRLKDIIKFLETQSHNFAELTIVMVEYG